MFKYKLNEKDQQIRWIAGFFSFSSIEKITSEVDQPWRNVFKADTTSEMIVHD